MSCKIHKTPDWKQTGQPFKFRPINACCGTWMNCWSKWLDYHLQKLTVFIPTHVNDANILLDWLKEIKDLPPYAFFFTSDADAMYNNMTPSTPSVKSKHGYLRSAASLTSQTTSR